jgi:branched-chain amino acid transport system permease protein
VAIVQALLPFLVVGLSVGAVYALSAVGLVVLYRASGVVNLAHGALGGLSAMLCWEVIDRGAPDAVGYLAGIAAATLVSAFYGRSIAPALSHQDKLVRAVATLGLALMITGLAQWYWGDEPRRLVLPTDGGGIEWDGRRLISHTRLLALLCAVAMTLGTVWLLARTAVGLKMRALQSDRELSALLGIRIRRTDTLAWMLAGAFAGIAGIFMGNMVRLNPTVLTFLVIPAVAAAVVGRFASLIACVAGGVFIGLVESSTALWPAISRYGSATAFVVAIVALLWQQRAGISLSRDHAGAE